MNALLDQLNGKEAQEFVKSIEKIFADLPHLPAGITEFLVKIAPWLVGIGGILNILNALQMIQLAMNPAGSMFGRIMAEFTQVSPLYYWLSAAFGALSALLAFAAFSPLKARKMVGWMYLFWLNVLGIVASVTAVVMLGGSGIVGSVIGILIGLYILFEVKPHYSKDGVATKTEA